MTIVSTQMLLLLLRHKLSRREFYLLSQTKAQARSQVFAMGVCFGRTNQSEKNLTQKKKVFVREKK